MHLQFFFVDINSSHLLGVFSNDAKKKTYLISHVITRKQKYIRMKKKPLYEKYFIPIVPFHTDSTSITILRV